MDDDAFPEPGEVFALADAQYKGLTMVDGFLGEHVRPRVEAAAGANAEVAVAVDMLLRVIAWLRTFAKLTDPADYQAAAAGTRAMFEISVDLTLLHFDRRQNPVDKVKTWEMSAKLKHAEAVVRYVDGRGGVAPDGTEVLLRFPKQFGAGIRAARERHWPLNSGKPAVHPPRWTGRNLGGDAEAADRFVPAHGFVSFYEHRYRTICWNIHGSGLGGVRGLDMELFPGLTALAFTETSHFAVVAAEMALRFVGKWDTEVEVLFATFRREQKITVALMIEAHRAQRKGAPPGR
jgi:hypothetical protein